MNIVPDSAMKHTNFPFSHDVWVLFPGNLDGVNNAHIDSSLHSSSVNVKETQE